MVKDNFVYIYHIRDAIDKIDEYLQGISKKDFLQQTIVHDAIMHELQIIGEAIRHISSDFRKKHPNINWKEIVGMRSKIVHDYFGINLEIIWKAATEDVPKLKEDIKQILSHQQ